MQIASQANPLKFPPVTLGGNVFGWTADERESFTVLDLARQAGVSAVDTADSYSEWAHDGVGGQSEEIVGRWMRSRGARDETLVATKVGKYPGLDDIRPPTLRRGIDRSLARLGTDYVDLLYAHRDDGGPLEESLTAFGGLIREGKVRAYGLSNFEPERVAEAMAICRTLQLVPPQAVQNVYSLVEREYEQGLRDVVAAGNLAFLPHSALAGGFLTGKYRPGGGPPDTPRASATSAYLDRDDAVGLLAALDEIARERKAPMASVALAWVRAQSGVTSPIASARTPDQLQAIVRAVTLRLSSAELKRLAAV